MAEKYDSNGDYYTDSFKRKSTSVGDPLDRAADRQPPENPDGENEDSKLSQKATEYVRELMAEKIILDQTKMPNAARLIDSEITKVQQMGRATPKEFKFVDIYREKAIKVSVKVLVPVREHPKFNFVGKLLGPKGNSLKRLQEDTMCRMAILGRGCMRDRAKEEELRLSLDPKYAHLSDDLHVEISALGPPAEAHARVAFALAEVRKYLIPDSNDTIRQQQMREMEIISGGPPEVEPPRRSILHSAISKPRSVPPMRTATRTPVFSSRSVMPAKTKIMSILDRARVAMEESYGYEDGSFDRESYEPSSYLPPPPPASSTKSKYYPAYDYEPEYFKESSFDKYAEPSSSSTHWTKSSSRLPSESRYRTSPYSRPPK